MSNDFQLGQQVTIHGTVRKAKQYERSQSLTIWREEGPPTHHDAWGKSVPITTGLITGYRYVRDGINRYTYDDGNPVFKATKQHKVWLVSFDLRRDPAKCFNHQITETGDHEQPQLPPTQSPTTHSTRANGSEPDVL